MSLVWGWALPATEKLVALKLADCADDQGRNAFPAVATIAAECGLSRRGTQEILRRLEGRGCIEVQLEATNRKSTTYRVNLHAQVPAVAELGQAAAEGEPADQAAADRGAAGAPLGAQLVRPGGAAGAQGGAAGAPLGAQLARPIHQGTISEPSGDPARARDGRRAHPLDEPPVLSPKLLEKLDELRLAYPRKDGDARDEARAWRELALSVEQADFVIAHVRMRVRGGWVRDAGGTRFLPMLWRWLDRRGWTEQAAVAGVASANGLEGMRTVRMCDRCGGELEGRVVNGRAQFPPCARCAPSAAAAGQA